ncbi:hypothetical protein LTR53_008487 [Teratosphaeriaceae sp. CCFEE 6253]|nr:hypothetical protein LTR53_008487 [Teratosphaeriaceae sp. CCFEE 6253]
MSGVSKGMGRVRDSYPAYSIKRKWFLLAELPANFCVCEKEPQYKWLDLLRSSGDLVTRRQLIKPVE